MFSPSPRPTFFESLEPRALLSAAMTDQYTRSVPAVSAPLDAANDVSVDITDTTFPTSINTGDTPSGTVFISVKNLGTNDTPVNSTIDFSIRARLVGAPDSSGDIVLAVFNAQPIGNLTGGGVGESTFTLSFTLPASLPVGTFRIVVIGIPAASIGDANPLNNTGVAADTIGVIAANDVGVAVASTTFSSSIKSGDTPSGSVTVTVTNTGQSITPTGSTINLALFARLTSATNSSTDIPLDTITSQSIGLLSPLDSTDITFSFTLPVLDDGSYHVVVVGTPSLSIGDTNAANDTALSAFVIAVAKVSDVAVTVAGVSLPAAINAGETPSGTVSVSVNNAGQITGPSGATIDFSIRARPTDAFDDSHDVLLGSFNAQSVAGLEPGDSKLFVFDVTLSALLEAGTYHIAVESTVSSGVGDAVADNNSATSAYTLTVTGTKDAALNVTGVTLPTSVRSGQTPSGAVTITVTNNDDTTTPAGATIDFSIRARLTGSVDDTGDVLLATYKNEPIAGLGEGATATFVRNATLPADLPGGSYHIVVVATLSGSIAGNNALHDTATSVFTFSVTGPDLTVALGAITVPTSIVEGRFASGSVTATMTNSDTVTVPQNRVVDLQIRLAPIEGGDQILLTTLHGVRAGGLAAGASKTYKLAVSIKAIYPANTYRILAEIDPTNRVAETDETNNTEVSDALYTIAAPYADLTARVATGNLPIPIPAGKIFKTTVTISVINSGNVVTLDKTTFDMQIVLHNDDTNAEIVLLTIPNVSVYQLGAARPVDRKKNVTLPVLPAGSYRIIGIVDVNNTFAEINDGNNTATTVVFEVG